MRPSTTLLAMATTAPSWAAAAAAPATPGVLDRRDTGNMTFAAHPSPVALCDGAAGLDARSVGGWSSIYADDCAHVAEALPNGTWYVEDLATDADGSIWFWVVAYDTCNFGVNPHRRNTENVTFGDADVRSVISFAMQNFAYDSTFMNVSRGNLYGCNATDMTIEWILANSTGRAPSPFKRI